MFSALKGRHKVRLIVSPFQGLILGGPAPAQGVALGWYVPAFQAENGMPVK